MVRQAEWLCRLSCFLNMHSMQTEICEGVHHVGQDTAWSRAKFVLVMRCALVQERARKLRIFPDEEHPFAQHPLLVPWEMAPRRRRVKEPLFELPEGFEPLNSTAYRKRFEHMLQPEAIAEVVKQSDAVIPAAEPAQNA